MKKTESNNRITIEVNEGCISCPFGEGDGCGCDGDIRVTHDYTYPASCPLLTKTIEVGLIIEKLETKKV